MQENNLPVLVLKNTVLLPLNEVRMDFDTPLEKQIFSLSEGYYDSNILVINTDTNEEIIQASNLPNIGVVGKVKLHIDLPNGKTKVVVSGIKRVEIIDFVKGLSIQSNYLNKPLIKLILEKAYEIAMSSENITLNEAKKELLIKYLNYFKQYSEDREDQYELDENGIYFENVLNDITLFRHSKEYIKTILDESYNMYQKDLKDINDEFIKVQEEINEY